MKKLIYSQEDLDLILSLEMQTKDEEIEKLNEIIKPKQWDQKYIETLFSKSSKEEVLKAYTYKCEQLEKLHEEYNKKEIEAMKTNNIVNELEKWLKEYKIQCKKYDSNSTIDIINCILNKLKKLKEGK